MSYIFLAFADDTNAQLDAFSLTTFIPKNKLAIFDNRAGFYCRKDAEKMNIEELLGYLTYYHYGCVAVSIIKYNDKLDSDKRLISVYGKKYLGSCSKNIKKSDLIPFVSIYKNYHRAADYYEGWLNAPISHLFKALEKCNFNEKDFKDIENKRKQLIKPLIKQIEKKLNTYKDNIGNLPKLFLRNF